MILIWFLSLTTINSYSRNTFHLTWLCFRCFPCAHPTPHAPRPCFQCKTSLSQIPEVRSNGLYRLKAGSVFVLWVTWIVVKEHIITLVEVCTFISDKCLNCKYPACHTTSLWPLNTGTCFGSAQLKEPPSGNKPLSGTDWLAAQCSLNEAECSMLCAQLKGFAGEIPTHSGFCLNH